MADKRIRQLVIAVLVVVLVLGLLNIVSTAFSLLVPVALAAVAAFAFYKIVLEGRDSAETMEDEVAETTGLAEMADADDSAPVIHEDDTDAETDEARQRLSAVKRAQSEFFETTTPAEEILEQIKTRKQRLQGDDET